MKSHKELYESWLAFYSVNKIKLSETFFLEYNPEFRQSIVFGTPTNLIRLTPTEARALTLQLIGLLEINLEDIKV